jgi:outer membrane receptor protein involved in Fe transport
MDHTDASSPYYGGQLPYIPWHSGSAVLSAAYGGWTANYSFIYTGERYESSANIRENYAQPWYTSDLSLSRQLRVMGIKAKVTLEVNNLLDQQYDVILNYPMPGRNFAITLTTEL